jgi:hypothetical protein
MQYDEFCDSKFQKWTINVHRILTGPNEQYWNRHEIIGHKCKYFFRDLQEGYVERVEVKERGKDLTLIMSRNVFYGSFDTHEEHCWQQTATVDLRFVEFH